MKEMLVKVIREEDGQGMVEYGLIIAGIAVIIIAAIGLFGPSIKNMFNGINNNLNV